MGWKMGGRFKKGHMYTRGWFMLIVWQKSTQYCKAITFQLKINKIEKIFSIENISSFSVHLFVFSFRSLYLFLAFLGFFLLHAIIISEKAVAPHSSTLAWKIPWVAEPGGLQSMGSLRVGHDWVTSLSLFTFMHWRRKWQPTPVFLPGESQGRGAWWAAISGVAQSRTQLKWLSSSSSSDYYLVLASKGNSPVALCGLLIAMVSLVVEYGL